ncbi:3-dehydroquinate synthase, partial [Acetobacter lovaniensis]
KNDFSLVDGFMRQMLERHMDRQSFIFIIGGGAVMDAVGFAAALVHRDLRQVRVPTTVLGQNDAGVGVKNGVNFLGGKNALGTFA